MPINGWWIQYGGDLNVMIHVPSFEVAMDDYFEGYNLPCLVTNFEREPVPVSYARVEHYYASRSKVGLPLGKA